MQLPDLGALSVPVMASLIVAVVLLAIRIFVMQRVQTQRQRENRQETERLRSLASAYRSLAGSFSPALEGDRAQVEEALADVVLFGSLHQVQLASDCAHALVRGEPVDYQDLADEPRADLRRQLGLEPIPATLDLPHSGPGRTSRGGRGEGEGGDGRRGGRGGGGGGGGSGGGGGAAAGLGGLGAGYAASEGGTEGGQ